MNEFQTICSHGWQSWVYFFSQTEYFLQVQEFYNRQRIVLTYLHTRVKTLRLLQYWWKQDWTMLCCPHCSQLSTMLNNIVTPDSGSTILFNTVDKCEQRGQQNIVQSCWAACSAFFAVYNFGKILMIFLLLAELLRKILSYSLRF
jgi:hypothetical protein